MVEAVHPDPAVSHTPFPVINRSPGLLTVRVTSYLALPAQHSFIHPFIHWLPAWFLKLLKPPDVPLENDAGLGSHAGSDEPERGPTEGAPCSFMCCARRRQQPRPAGLGWVGVSQKPRDPAGAVPTEGST